MAKQFVSGEVAGIAQQVEDLVQRYITLTDGLLERTSPPRSVRNYIDSESTGSDDDSLACIMEEFSMLAGRLRYMTGTRSSI